MRTKDLEHCAPAPFNFPEQAMALLHAFPLDVIDLHAASGAGAATLSTSLLKTDRLQLLRLVLPAGHCLPDHQIAGEITIHCLAGEVSLSTPERTCLLRAGQLMALQGAHRHSLQAIADATLLVTVIRIA
jgi:quercetin dioxygenase-like cupin family protein